MSEDLLNKMIVVLHRNKDLFAWKATDIPGIDPEVISHKLYVCQGSNSVAQKKKKVGRRKTKSNN